MSWGGQTTVRMTVEPLGADAPARGRWNRTVPNVVGQDQQAAVDTLAGVGLKADTSQQQFNDQAPEGWGLALRMTF